jgi:hypothetical protein
VAYLENIFSDRKLVKTSAMRLERTNIKQGKKMMKLRQSTMEPVFGSLINYFGMKQVNTKRIESANKVMLGITIAYNLKKYLKFLIKTTKSEAKALRKELFNKGINLSNDLEAFFFEKYHPLAIMQFIHW